MIKETIEIKSDEFPTLVSTNNTVITDVKLLEKLRMLRNKIAEEKGYKKYYIFTNEILSNLATERPTNKSEFLSVKGVGERKYALYGQAFIKVIKEHVEN